MATGLFLLGRLQAFQHFRLTPGLLPEHRIRNVRLQVRSHLILRSFRGLAPAADLEGAIRMAPAADLEGAIRMAPAADSAAAVPLALAADSAAEAIRVGGAAWGGPGGGARGGAAVNPYA